MISTLGKRKRRDQIQKLDSDVSTISDQETSRQLQTLLQQHFEATFEPLKGVRQSVHEEAEGEAQAVKIDTESNWTGISEEEDEDPQQIFHYHVSHSSKLEVPKEELKTFMVWAKGIFQILEVFANCISFQVNKASIYRRPINIEDQIQNA